MAQQLLTPTDDQDNASRWPDTGQVTDQIAGGSSGQDVAIRSTAVVRLKDPAMAEITLDSTEMIWWKSHRTQLKITLQSLLPLTEQIAELAANDQTTWIPHEKFMQIRLACKDLGRQGYAMEKLFEIMCSVATFPRSEQKTEFFMRCTKLRHEAQLIVDKLKAAYDDGYGHINDKWLDIKTRTGKLLEELDDLWTRNERFAHWN